MLALSAGIKPLDAVSDGVIHALVKTGFEMQTVELSQTSPVTTIQTAAPDQGLKAAVSDFLAREREGVLAYAEEARTALPYRQA